MNIKACKRKHIDQVMCKLINQQNNNKRYVPFDSSPNKNQLIANLQSRTLIRVYVDYMNYPLPFCNSIQDINNSVFISRSCTHVLKQVNLFASK